MDTSAALKSAPADKQPPVHHSSAMFSGMRVVSLCTVASRLLGLVRDVGMAALFGNSLVMDTFSVAWRIPNLARRLFGEGALTAAFLPVFLRELNSQNRDSAWNLAAAVFALLFAALCLILVAAELLLGAAWVFVPTGGEARLLIGLTAVMLPYLILICLAAQAAAVLHAFGRFTRPALLPVILNVIWIFTIWMLAPRFGSPVSQIYLVAGAVLIGGLLQLVIVFPPLFRLGFRLKLSWKASRRQVTQITRAMLPILVGLSVTQFNVILDSLIAWGFSPPQQGPTRMNLPGSPPYPVAAGTASALYFGQRMYQFPLGVFGVALGTVIFPLLAQHAERGQLRDFRSDLRLGLQLVLGIGLPASAGLILLAEPLTALLFQHGAFDAQDAAQTAGMIVAYGTAVWAFCGLLIVHRAYYALGDRATPLKIGLIAVALNLVLNLTLIWFIGGFGLAWATAFSAMVQVALVTASLQWRLGPMEWRSLGSTLWRTAAATAVMGAACLLVLGQIPPGPTVGERLLRCALPVAAAVAAYFTAAALLGMHELRQLFSRRTDESNETGP